MVILPAVDLIEGQAVRLFQGDYGQKTVYENDPVSVALRFADAGARFIHIVDLDGAKTGKTENFDVIRRMIRASFLKAEVGGGIRSFETVDRYLEAGAERIVLGTKAVTDPDFLQKALETYGDRIAVGADLRDGKVSIRGWTEDSGESGEEFCKRMSSAGLKTLICTDISRDGAMQGTNHQLYRQLMKVCSCDLIASGGVSSVDEVVRLKNEGLAGAILGKALYTGAIDLKQAIEVCT